MTNPPGSDPGVFSTRLLLCFGAASAALFAIASARFPHATWPAAVLWGMLLLGVSRGRSRGRAAWLSLAISAAMGALASAHLWGIAYYSSAVYVVVIAYHALLWGAYGALASSILRSGSARSQISAAAAWALIESVRGVGAFSFPFFFGGMLASEVYPVQVASLLGAASVSFVVFVTGLAAASYLLAWAGDSRLGARRQWLPGLVVCVATWSFGVLRVHASPAPRGATLRVSAIQGSVPSWLYSLATGPGPFRRVVEEHYGALYRVGRDAGAQLLLFPETAFDWHLRPDTETIRRIAPFSAEHLPQGTGVLFGASFSGLEGWESVNGVGVLTGDSKGRPTLRGVVEKRQLVPFIEVGHKRADRWLLADVEGTRVGVMVCYESMYPAAAVHHANAGADLLVVLSDDGGMRRSRLGWTHSEQAKLRAIEAGLPLVRAGQAGPSYIIDAFGRTHESLGAWEVGTLTSNVTLERRFSLWRILGQWTSSLWLFLALLDPVLRRREQRRSDKAAPADDRGGAPHGEARLTPEDPI